MKFKALAASVALAATSLVALAAPAAADPPRHGGWQRPEITVATDRGVASFDRGDRMFYRLSDAPYRFQPGYTYEYTDRCNRRGCTVIVYRGRHDRPVDRIFAPYLPRPVMAASEWRRGSWRNDDVRRDDGWRDGRPYEDRPGTDDRRNDGPQRPDNRDNNDRRGDDGYRDLNGGPRGR